MKILSSQDFSTINEERLAGVNFLPLKLAAFGSLASLVLMENQRDCHHHRHHHLLIATSHYNATEENMTKYQRLCFLSSDSEWWLWPITTPNEKMMKTT